MTVNDISGNSEGCCLPELSIIIVNWNSLDYLRQCLGSIYDSAGEVGFEIIVVDNGSSQDESVTIRNEFPQVITIRSEENLGFARANNLGFEHASGQYLLFLNPDTKLVGLAVDTILNVLKSNPEVGIVGCRLLNSDGSLQASCIQRYPTILNQMLDLEFLRLHWPHWKVWGIAPLYSNAKQLVDVEVISGACLMIRRDAFERAGNFNEQYFMYAEDVDLCYKIRKEGWRVCYSGEATVVHHGGGASKWQKGNNWVAIMQRQAILKFCRNSHGRLYAAVFRAATALNAMFRLLILAILSPFRQRAAERQLVHSSLGKWLSVLKWAIGMNRVSNLHDNV